MRYRKIDDKNDSGNWVVDILDEDGAVFRLTIQWCDLEDLEYDMEILKIKEVTG